MTRDDIIRMARESSFTGSYVLALDEELERFAALVAAAVKEEMKWDGIHTCGAHCQRPACVNIRKAVEREREECAKVCDLGAEHMLHKYKREGAARCAAAIRARWQE